MIKLTSNATLFLLTLLTCLTPYAAENDFNIVCGYFIELKALPKINTMTHLQRNNFILKRMSANLPASSNAQAAWSAVAYAVAEERYEIFKVSAESILNHPWTCPAMEKLAAITGEF